MCSTQNFIERARKIHGDKYDYSLVKYQGRDSLVTIICPIHGEFQVLPGDFLLGDECPKCEKKSESLTEDFIRSAREVHGDRYDYSKVEYKNSSTKVTIICSEHGEFEQTPYNHLRGSGCPKCSRGSKLTTEEFIRRAREVHGDKYDYSKVVYKNSYTKITIICPEHGEFEQEPTSHLSGRGCPKCSKTKLTTEDFIRRAIEVHGNKYDYSKVDYKDNKTKVTILCPIHGEFEQIPSNHLSGSGCRSCKISKDVAEETEKFIRKAKKLYNDKYDYSKVVYKGDTVRVCIICPIHGEFWQTPSNHLRGGECPKCGGATFASRSEMNTESFIQKARAVFGDRYDYSKVSYKDSKTKVTIICPIHGEFLGNPLSHTSGIGCPKCAGTTKPSDWFIESVKAKNRFDYGEATSDILSTEDFIRKSREIYGDEFDYSKTNFVNSWTKVTIICRIHGEFEQIPNVHLAGRGCPKCQEF